VQSQDAIAELTQALSSRQRQIEALELQILVLRRYECRVNNVPLERFCAGGNAGLKVYQFSPAVLCL
jgi:hypothetical protein